MPKPEPRPRICDYEGSNYRTEFWENKDRDYEDRVERIALRRLLPQNGKRLLELGAGFGRLTNEYYTYKQVILVDYSLSQLQYAQEKLGRSQRFVYVAADAYKLPFRPGVCDAATMIRVIHHMADAPAVLAQIHRVLTPGATFILEHANKQNFKAMLRYALKRQDWSPYQLDPVEFVELNFDFHPAYIMHELRKVGFDVHQRLPVSFFRLGLLKRTLPTGVLVGLDSLLQYTGLLYSPSVFVKAVASNIQSEDNRDVDNIFACPETGVPLVADGDVLTSPTTGMRWAIRDGIYDFKAPLD